MLFWFIFDHIVIIYQPSSLWWWPVALLPHGDSWTLSWRRLRSRTQSAPSCWLTRWPSWWPLVSRAHLWPPPWRCPHTPFRRSPGPAPCAWWSSPWPPPTHLGRTLVRHDGQQVSATHANTHPSTGVKLWQILSGLTFGSAEVLRVDRRIKNSIPQSVAVPVINIMMVVMPHEHKDVECYLVVWKGHS